MSSSSSNALALLSVLLLLGSIAPIAACDDAVTPPADDGKIKAELSGGCRADKTQAPLTGFQSQTPMIVKGIDRTYDWFIPPAHDGRTPIPIVFVFHDAGSSGAGVRAAFKLEDAIGGKAIVVYPDAVGVASSKSWDLERGGETNADMFFFDQILSTIADGYCIDTKRVFVTGFSNGASFANNLGCIRGGSIAAVSALEGTGPANSDYMASGELDCPQKPVAAMIIHGTADTAVPLSQGQASRDHWTKVNGCRSGGLEVFDPAPCKNQLNCARDRPVVYCEIPDLGHSVWDQAPRATWNFFSSL